jgi:hypothetical protein
LSAVVPNKSAACSIGWLFGMMTSSNRTFPDGLLTFSGSDIL